MLSLLRKWAAADQRSALVALHDPTLALNACDRLLLGEHGILGILEPRTTPLDQMEQMLRQVYGDITLQHCRNRRGEGRIVILSEDNL